MNTKIKLDFDRLVLWLGRLSIEIYWPALYNRHDNKGISLPTTILYRPFNQSTLWKWRRAFVFRVIGLGIGFAIDHVENPFKKELK